MAKRRGVGLALPALVLVALIGRCGTATQSTPQAKLESPSAESRWTRPSAATAAQDVPAVKHVDSVEPKRRIAEKPRAPLESAKRLSPGTGENRNVDEWRRVQPKSPTPKDVARLQRQLVQESIDQYSGPCPCPYNVARNGSSCGRRSAYSRPGGESPLCYPSDVSDSLVAAAWEAEATN